MTRQRGSTLLVGVLAALASCAPSQRTLLSPVSSELTARGLPAMVAVEPDRVAVSSAVAEVLAQPLSLDGAVRVALAQNRRLAAQAEELGIARAELTAAALPAVELSATYHLGTLELDALADVLSLLELPGRRKAASAQVERARAQVVAHAVRLAAEVELAFGLLQAAMAKAELHRHYFDAADAAALLQERAHEAGGSTELALARQLEQRETARARLGRARGVPNASAGWSVIAAPPVLPAQAPALDELEREAVAASTELAATRATARARARLAGASELRRFLPRLAVGAVAETDEDDHWSYGPAVRLALPLPTETAAAARRDRARLRQTQHELYATAVELRSAAREARLAALGAYAEAAQLRDVVVPLRQRVLDEIVRHYNAMNADTFAVLAAQQALVEGRQMLLEATARFTAAMAQVAALRRGVMPVSSSSPGAPAADAPADPSSAGAERAGGHGLH